MNLKNLLLAIISFVCLSIIARAQNTNTRTSCFDDYNYSFKTRGALDVPDGMQKVVVAVSDEAGKATCRVGQIMVKNSAFVLPLYLVRDDGSLTETVGVLDYNFYRQTGGQVTANIQDGTSAVFYLEGKQKARLFFLDYLKPEPGATIAAPALSARTTAPPPQKDILDKIDASAHALQFETGKDVLSKGSFAVLDVIAQLMNQNPDTKWFINGYTDNTGNENANMVLSEKRVEAVVNYLIRKGVKADRLYAAGHGQNDPIADNSTADGRQQNRRVEIKPIM